MLEILSGIWGGLGTAGQTVVIMGLMSILSMLVSKIPGPIGALAKKLVDFFSANLSHK
jgi:hypothetical protein